MELRPVTPISILAQKLDNVFETHVEVIRSNPGLADDLKLCYQIASGLDPYTEKHTTQESAALKDLRNRRRIMIGATPITQNSLKGWKQRCYRVMWRVSF